MLAIVHTLKWCKNVTPTQYRKTTQQNNVIITMSTYKTKQKSKTKNIVKHKNKVFCAKQFSKWHHQPKKKPKHFENQANGTKTKCKQWQWKWWQ